jgi:hypothetical protein
MEVLNKILFQIISLQYSSNAKLCFKIIQIWLITKFNPEQIGQRKDLEFLIIYISLFYTHFNRFPRMSCNVSEVGAWRKIFVKIRVLWTKWRKIWIPRNWRHYIPEAKMRRCRHWFASCDFEAAASAERRVERLAPGGHSGGKNGRVNSAHAWERSLHWNYTRKLLFILVAMLMLN